MSPPATARQRHLIKIVTFRCASSRAGTAEQTKQRGAIHQPHCRGEEHRKGDASAARNRGATTRVAQPAKHPLFVLHHLSVQSHCGRTGAERGAQL